MFLGRVLILRQSSSIYIYTPCFSYLYVNDCFHVAFPQGFSCPVSDDESAIIFPNPNV
jgi:hypothetical protein